MALAGIEKIKKLRINPLNDPTLDYIDVLLKDINCQFAGFILLVQKVQHSSSPFESGRVQSGYKGHSFLATSHEGHIRSSYQPFS